MIARSTCSAIACASSSGSSPGSFRWSETWTPSGDSITERLWISRTRETDIADSRTRSLSAASTPAGSTWTTTSLPGSAPCDRGLDPVGDRVTLADGSPGDDTDDDVGERATGGLAQTQPAELHGWIEACDRGSRSEHRVGRRPVHQHVDVPADQPAGGRDDEERDEQRGDGVASRPTGPDDEKTREDGERADEIAPEVECVRGEGRALEQACRPERDERPRNVDRDHDPDCGEHPPRGRGLDLDPACDPGEGERTHDEADEQQHERLGECRQVLRLAVTVRMREVGGLGRDADREEGEERRHEVCPRVQRLGDEAEATAREAGSELHPHQRHRGTDRDECSASLWAHGEEPTRGSRLSFPRRHRRPTLRGQDPGADQQAAHDLDRVDALAEQHDRDDRCHKRL